MIVCICKNLRTEDIETAIDNGANTIEALRDNTGATSCCGKCQFKVNRVLQNTDVADVATAVGSN